MPCAVFSISWMRPRGESISSLQQEYVGQVGRQKPQWTQARVSSVSSRSTLRGRPCRAGWRMRIRAEHRSSEPGSHEHPGRVEPLLQRALDPTRGRPGTPPTRCGTYAMPGGRADDRLVERREDVREIAGREPDAPERARLALAGLAPDRVVRRLRPRRARAPRRAAPRPRAPPPSKSTATRPGWRTSSALGWSCDRRSSRTTPAGSVALDDEGRGRGGQGVEPQRDPGDQGEAPLRPADELAEVVARDVLHDLPAGARDRPVAEHERHAEDEVARRPEAVRERPREPPCEARADRGIARRVEREPLTAGGERVRSAESRMPASTVHVRSPASCSRIRSSRVGREVLADPDPAPGGARIGEERRRLLDRRGPHQNRSARPSRSSGCVR